MDVKCCKKILCFILGLGLLAGCQKGDNPIDPYEPVNREIYKFNKAFDATFIRPPATFYNYAVYPPVKKGISNFFSNLQLLPTAANDLLQGQLLQVYKDCWRFFLNSTIGVAGIADPAQKMGLPPHVTDLGITLAKWGDHDSPYMMLPIFGPSTFRDTAGWLFDTSIFTIYPYMDESVAYGLGALRTIQLRADLLKSDAILKEAFDEYQFVRDAYLQNRQYQIDGRVLSNDEPESLYIEDEDDVSVPNEELVKRKTPPKTMLAHNHQLQHHLRG
jgi:phospholipid-binding lipoprotein MlaA